MKEYLAERLLPGRYLLGESPFYDARFERLSWVDILEGKLYTMKGGEVRCHAFDEPIGAAVPLHGSDGFLVAGKKSLWAFEAGARREIVDLSRLYQPHQRSNDAKADPFGRLFFGASNLDGVENEPSGNLFRYDGGKLTIVQRDTRISNGMAWSRDRKTFFFSDSLCYAVFAYDYAAATGDISNRRVLFNVEGGVSDGMCIDDQDRLWVAIWGGSRVECRDTKTGALEAVVRVPAEHVSSCCFFGEKLDRLFITTSGNGLSGEGDGGLFECAVDARGMTADCVDLP